MALSNSAHWFGHDINSNLTSLISTTHASVSTTTNFFWSDISQPLHPLAWLDREIFGVRKRAWQ